jgi:hypothetical protein
MLRPALVALRLRNPCSLFRRILLGWYVRFTTTASHSYGALRKSAAIKHAVAALSTDPRTARQPNLDRRVRIRFAAETPLRQRSVRGEASSCNLCPPLPNDPASIQPLHRSRLIPFRSLC